MKRIWPAVILIFSLQAASVREAGACTDIFASRGGWMVSGRNIDWPIDNYLRMSLNPRGTARTAVPLLPGDRPVSWVSQYGSITLGLYFVGAYIHLDGMNEHGLSVAMLMMTDSEYPPPDSRPYLNDDRWPQYYLDNCRTVAEAVALAEGMRILCLVGGHLVLHDPTGDSAVMEYVGGELRIHRPPEYNGVLTNNPAYEEQLANLADYQGFGGDLPLPGGVESTSRFVRASWYLQTLPVPRSHPEAIGSVLAIMQNAAKPLYDREQSCTLSTSIRDHIARRYYWRSFCRPNLRYVDLGAVDFTAGNPVRVLDLFADLEGDVERYFQPDPAGAAVAGGDYDGDGTSDIAVFRAAVGLWAVRGVTRAHYGSWKDLPVSADYDGDGTADIAVYRGAAGLWAVRGITRCYFGSPGSLPVPGDYDGDGTHDVAVFRETTGLWAARGVTRAYFGGIGDLPVAGDYDGDGTAEIAVRRRRIEKDIWIVRGLSRFYFGDGMGSAAPGDYDGDGTWEAARFGPLDPFSLSGRWEIRGVSDLSFGRAIDLPVPGDYAGSGFLKPAVFREDIGLWAVRGVTRAYFGGRGDIPVSR